MLQSANASSASASNATLDRRRRARWPRRRGDEPRVGIAVDSVSFFLAAVVPCARTPSEKLRLEASNFMAELAAGWREFISRTWLWAIVLQFGFVNAIMLWNRRRARAFDREGASWRCGSVGVHPHRRGAGSPRGRPDPASNPTAAPLARGDARLPADDPFLLGLAGRFPSSPWLLLALLAGIGIETFSDLVGDDDSAGDPAGEALTCFVVRRLGSFALMPLGLAIAGPSRRIPRDARDDPPRRRDQRDRDARRAPRP